MTSGHLATQPAPGPRRHESRLSRLAGRDPLYKAITVAYFATVFVLLLAPLVVVIGSSFSAPASEGVSMSYVQFPPERLTLK